MLPGVSSPTHIEAWLGIVDKSPLCFGIGLSPLVRGLIGFLAAGFPQANFPM